MLRSRFLLLCLLASACGPAADHTDVTKDQAVDEEEGNSLPSIKSVTLSPSPAYATTEIKATPNGWADADGHTPAYEVKWKVNGVLDTGVTGLTYPAGHPRGTRIQAEVTPKDGAGAGTPVASDVLTLSNSIPSAGSALLSPATAYATSDIVVNVTGWSDEDSNDTPQFKVRWLIDGIEDPSVTGTLYPAGPTAGTFVQAEVTPTDLIDDGAVITTSVLTIANTIPAITSVELTSPAYKTSVVTATPTGWSDADGESPAYTIQWRVNGVIDGGATGLTYPAGLTKGTTLQAEVTPKNGASPGTMVASTILTISNSLPTISSVTLTPSPAYVTSAVTATPNGWTDADGDAPNYNVAWSVDGTIDGSQTGYTYPAGLARGKTLQATLTPKNASALGAAVASSVLTITNSRPIITGGSFSPTATIDAGEPLLLSGTASDPDGTTPGLATIRWRVGGISRPELNDLAVIPYFQLSSGNWSADVTVSDGSLESAAYTVSASLTVTAYDPIVNTGPSLFNLTAIRDASTLNAVSHGVTDCPTNADYLCYDISFDSPSPTNEITLTTAAWLIVPKTLEKPLAMVISLHGSGGQRDRGAAVTLAQNLNAIGSSAQATHQIGVIAISGPGEEGSNGPSIDIARAYAFPDPRRNWDHLYAYVAMRTVTFVKDTTLINVDDARIGMTGVSAGGNATLLSNGIDNRLALALPLSATGYFEESYSLANSWMEEMASVPATYQTAVAAWMDPKAYLTTQSAPTKIVNGAQDEFFPLISTRLTYDDIASATKGILLVNDLDHYYYLTSTPSLTKVFTGQASWIAKYLMGVPLSPAATPTTSPVDTSGGTVAVTITAQPMAVSGITEARTATLYASNDNGYTFTAYAMIQTGNDFTYTGPQSGAWATPAQTVWFAEVKDTVTVPFCCDVVWDYRSTLPVYPVGFQQDLRARPN